jgi:hypothetical protein
VVEHSIGNGEVDSSILSGSTIFQPQPSSMNPIAGRSACAPDFAGINFQGSILQGINIK